MATTMAMDPPPPPPLPSDEELELLAWKQETQRYLLKHVEPAIDGALQELERLDFLWGRIRLSKTTQSPSIKANIRVEGHLVVYANVELRLTKPSRNWPVSGALQQYCVLNQILEFHSVLQALLKRLQSLKASLVVAHDDLQSDAPQCDVAFFTDMAQKVFADLSVVCRELRATANVLRLPSRCRFPHSAYVDHNFKPSLPPEIVVDFSIHRGEMIMEVWGLALSHKPLTEIPPGCRTKKELVGCVCSCRAQKVEIVDYASTSIAIPQLDEMLNHLDEQTTWLVQVRDNIKALLDCVQPLRQGYPPEIAPQWSELATCLYAFTLNSTANPMDTNTTGSPPTDSPNKALAAPTAEQTNLSSRVASINNRPPAKLVSSESARVMTGLKPHVPLRKRGMSFKETKRINLLVDDQGRRHLNQYTFLEELGRGAYGVVLRVQSNETKEFFAAKTVNKKALKKIRVGRFGNALQSVKKELAIWQKFMHRHVVVLREVIDTDESDELYMISELVEGGTVLDGDAECTPLNAELTKLYFCQLIEGIEFLHENKIIHRDIKPGNLLLKKSEDGEMILKLADFGVSHEMENDDDSLRQTAGTAIFSAPEMLTGEKFHGKPVDVWACGITLYMFVYGHPPYVAKTMIELYSKIQNDPIEYQPSVGDRVVEPELIDLLKHILEKDPAKRYTTQQIRAHPWAWRDFQVTAMKCVTQPQGRRVSRPDIPKSFSSVVGVGKSLRMLFARKSVVPSNGDPPPVAEERVGAAE